MTDMNLFKRNPDVPSCPWSVRFMVRGKAYLWSTKTPDKGIAAKRAKDYREKVVAEAWHLVDAMKTVSGTPTFGGLIKLYDTMPTPDPRTKSQNVAGLRSIMACHGFTEHDRLDRITSQFVLKYQQVCTTARPGVESALVTCNSHVRRARSLFSRRCLAAYEGVLAIPDAVVKAMFKIPLLKESERRPDMPSLEALQKAQEALKTHPDHYRAYLLVRYGGLRAGEVINCRREWLEGNVLYVGGKPEVFRAKSRKWRAVALPLEVVDILNQSDDPVYFIGPRRTVIVRHEISPMLRLAGFTSRNPLHSLRALFGSHVYTEQGPRQARDVLGHSTQAVTDKSYARSLDAPKPVAFAG